MFFTYNTHISAKPQLHVFQPVLNAQTTITDPHKSESAFVSLTLSQISYYFKITEHVEEFCLIVFFADAEERAEAEGRLLQFG